MNPVSFSTKHARKTLTMKCERSLLGQWQLLSIQRDQFTGIYQGKPIGHKILSKLIGNRTNLTEAVITALNFSSSSSYSLTIKCIGIFNFAESVHTTTGSGACSCYLTIKETCRRHLFDFDYTKHKSRLR